MNFRIHSLLYFGTGIVFMTLETMQAFYPALVVKVLIIPVLAWLYLRFIRGEANNFHRIILLALLFSWIGDVILHLAGLREEFFLGGLGSFLVAQVLYLIAFFSTQGTNLLARKLYLVLPVILYGTFILWFLWEGLGEMRLPVTVYCIVILTMLTAAINRKEKVNAQSYRLVLLGAILFVLSDSLIALNKFREPFELARITIMTSYITAQYLIALGCLRQHNLSLKN